MSMNRFGAVYTAVPSLYQGSVAADFGGQTVIETAMDRAVDAIVASMPERIFQQVQEIDLEQVVRRGVAGTTVLPATSMKPLVFGSVRVWRGDRLEFDIRPSVGSSSNGIPDISASLFSVVLATGVVTLIDPLANEEVVYVSAEVDTENAAYSVPSIARMVAVGAAGQLGEVLYSEGNQEWRLVEMYRTAFDDYLKGLQAGSVIPDEVRRGRYWSSPAPLSGISGSVELIRG